MSNALMVRDDGRMSVAFTQSAIALRDAALEQAALVGRVANADEQQTAVLAQAALAEILTNVEKARKAAKEPVLNFGRAIDDAAKVFVTEAKSEQLRVGGLVSDFQNLERIRIQAARDAENARLAQLERERAAALAQAETVEKVNAIQEQFSNRARDEAPPPQSITAARATGQRVREEWNIEVVDIWLLAKAHPGCVKIEPRLNEIKSLLDAGIKVAGVRAAKEIRAGVSVHSARAIDV